MKNYRKIANFYYKDNKYVMLLDNNNKHFFLRTDEEGHLSYISLFELIDLTNHFMSIPLVMNIEKENKKQKKMKLLPKVLIGTSLLTLSTPVLFAGYSYYSSLQRINSSHIAYQSNVESTNIVKDEVKESYTAYTSLSEDEEKEELVVDTYYKNDLSGNIYIYDMNYLDQYFNYKSVSIEQIKETIQQNSNISDKYKQLLFDYCDSVGEKYPDIDLRVFYENMKSLEVVECTEQELLKVTWNVNSCGCYVQKENKIYVLKDYEYEKGTWDYQVIMHEFSHALRSYYRDLPDGTKVRINFLGLNYNNLLTEEALNSLFAVSLLNYEEKDIAYQLQSNYHSAIIDSLDNYELSDYVNHSCSYYAKKLDEFTGDDNRATTMIELMQLQYDDFHDETLNVEQSEFYPIYDYVSEIYYKNRIKSDMSYDEAKLIEEELVDRIVYDVPSDYNIDVDHFNDYFKDYCNDLGIKTKTR